MFFTSPELREHPTHVRDAKQGAECASKAHRKTQKGVESKSCMAIKPKKKKSNQKLKFNITLREDTKQKLAALAGLEKRSVSNLIEILADERWEQLADREGVDYAKTVAEIAGLKGLRADRKADRKIFRREILERVLKFKKR
jgi:hypothetical protein